MHNPVSPFQHPFTALWANHPPKLHTKMAVFLFQPQTLNQVLQIHARTISRLLCSQTKHPHILQKAAVSKPEINHKQTLLGRRITSIHPFSNHLFNVGGHSLDPHPRMHPVWDRLPSGPRMICLEQNKLFPLSCLLLILTENSADDWNDDLVSVSLNPQSRLQWSSSLLLFSECSHFPELL